MKKGKAWVEEFKTFIMRGNVIDMAIGVIIGGAFGKISTSLVNDLLMPFISWICGTRDMSVLNLVVRQAELNPDGSVAREAIVLGFGTLLGTVIDFLLIALVVFLLIKAMNNAHRLFERKAAEEEAAAAEEAPAAPPAPTTEELLAEILDELKKQNGKSDT